jgi:hypothetical protein
MCNQQRYESKKYMNIDDFKRRVNVILEKPAADIREKFIFDFVNTNLEFYEKHIRTTSEFKDGYYYTGFLWDCLKSFGVITEKDLCSRLEKNAQSVYAMWDLHSSERTTDRDYWKFPRDAVLFAPANIIREGRHLLPVDLYIFDDNFEWSLILRHENYEDEHKYRRRYCLEASPNYGTYTSTSPL